MIFNEFLFCFRAFQSSSLLSCRVISRMYTNKIGVNGDSSYIDIRSDTVTRACAEMRKRMAEAIVGDDVYAEDPTVNSLEERCAKLFNKEAGLFVATGTMGNLISIMAHTMGRGSIIVGRTNHIHRWEQGNYARLAGVPATTIPVKTDGTMSLEDIEEACCPGDDHQAQTKLICLENTHNFTGGKALTVEYMQKVRRIADKHNLKIHVDGARIFNAAVKLGVTVAELTKDADSVQFCFSKGLGAPIGTVVVGTKEFIQQARLDRKIVGGGWRQAGHLAAAAHYSLDNAIEWITKDHERASKLAKALIDLKSPKVAVEEEGMTNMVLLRVADPEAIVEKMKELGVLVMHFDHYRIRVVLHRDVTDEALDKVIDAFTKVFSE